MKMRRGGRTERVVRPPQACFQKGLRSVDLQSEKGLVK